ncbi:hypothetical protein PPBDW_I20512 [Photobacterium kishitanii]|nr:hypothetical protein PPBDW_I20512 [Photobacterium kishitanii]
MNGELNPPYYSLVLFSYIIFISTILYFLFSLQDVYENSYR